MEYEDYLLDEYREYHPPPSPPDLGPDPDTYGVLEDRSTILENLAKQSYITVRSYSPTTQSSEIVEPHPSGSGSQVRTIKVAKMADGTLWEGCDGMSYLEALSYPSPNPQNVEPDPLGKRIRIKKPKPPFRIPDWMIGKRRGPCCCIDLLPGDSYAPDPEEVRPFNHFRYMEYAWIKDKVFGADRLKYVRQGLDVQETFTDEEILGEMSDQFGRMDTSTEKFKELFKIFKASFNKRLEECRRAETDYGGRPRPFMGFENMMDVDDEVEEVKLEIRMKFTPKEIAMYDTLNPEINPTGFDWIDVPRPVKETRSWREKVPPSLRQSLSTLISEYPLGLCIDMLFLRAAERFGLIDYFGMGFRNDWSFIKYLDDVFYINKYKEQGMTILFPAHSRGYVLPLKGIFRKIAYDFMAALRDNNGVVGLTNLMKLIDRRDLPEGQHRFHFWDWGYECRKTFVEDIMKSNERFIGRGMVEVRSFLVKDETGKEIPTDFLICPERPETKRVIKIMKPDPSIVIETGRRAGNCRSFLGSSDRQEYRRTVCGTFIN